MAAGKKTQYATTQLLEAHPFNCVRVTGRLTLPSMKAPKQTQNSVFEPGVVTAVCGPVHLLPRPQPQREDAVQKASGFEAVITCKVPPLPLRGIGLGYPTPTDARRQAPPRKGACYRNSACRSSCNLFFHSDALVESTIRRALHSRISR